MRLQNWPSSLPPHTSAIIKHGKFRASPQVNRLNNSASKPGEQARRKRTRVLQSRGLYHRECCRLQASSLVSTKPSSCASSSTAPARHPPCSRSTTWGGGDAETNPSEDAPATQRTAAPGTGDSGLRCGKLSSGVIVEAFAANAGSLR